PEGVPRRRGGAGIQPRLLAGDPPVVGDLRVGRPQAVRLFEVEHGAAEVGGGEAGGAEVVVERRAGPARGQRALEGGDGAHRVALGVEPAAEVEEPLGLGAVAGGGGLEQQEEQENALHRGPTGAACASTVVRRCAARSATAARASASAPLIGAN